MCPGKRNNTMEGPAVESKLDTNAAEHYIVLPGQNHSIENDINRLFETIDIKTTRDTLRKSAMKRPIRAGSSPASGIGISEPISLKQALRGLCISQASEVAAMKRLSRPAGSGASEAGTIKRLYRAVVVDASQYGHHHSGGKGNMVEISFVPERATLNIAEGIPEVCHVSKMEQSYQTAAASVLVNTSTSAQKDKISRAVSQDVEIVPLPNSNYEASTAGFKLDTKMKIVCSSFANDTCSKSPIVADVVFPPDENPTSSVEQDTKLKVNPHCALSLFSSGCESKCSKAASSGLRFSKPVSMMKTVGKKKVSQKIALGSSQCDKGNQKDLGCNKWTMVLQRTDCALSSKSKEKENPSPASTNVKPEVASSSTCSGMSKPGLLSNYGSQTTNVVRTDDHSGYREKGEFSQSSKSSIGEYSSRTSLSEESQLSSSSRCGNRPHMSKDVRWEAIRSIQRHHGSLGLRHFKLLRKLGSGDIARVYLAELTGTNCLFALKVMDNELLASKRKLARAQTEKQILQVLDHPFLPTLFAHFAADKYSCLVMEHCPGGDLHVLRQKQPGKSFSEQAARFYVSEVLLALEYLHMLGVVYRDLKPENILVREDGHIMLSDFDLSLRCAASPTLLKSSPSVDEAPKRTSSLACSESSCIEPFCLHPSWQVPCFTPRFLSATAKARKLKSDLASQVSPLPQLVVEPTSARSNSFVGTHEYLAPEIIKGEGHGSSVDWWTFGIFLYELLCGRTPFKGVGNEETLANVVSQCLKFPESPMIGVHARDLIRRLLKKEPGSRLGSLKGAAEIKHHPFFEGMNWALVRCTTPPELPKLTDADSLVSNLPLQNKESIKCGKAYKYSEADQEFEIF